MDAVRALALAGTGYGVFVLWAAFHPAPDPWGVHAPGFLPPLFKALTLGLTVLGAALLLSQAVRRGPRRDARPEDDAASRRADGAWRSAWMLALPFAVAAWLLRARTHFLGDQSLWLDRLQSGAKPLYSEPLAAAIWHAFGTLLRALGAPIDPRSLALLPALLGLLAFTLAWAIATDVATAARGRWLALATLATLGTVQLYCGYLETYAIASIGILAFLWLGLRPFDPRGEGPADASAGAGRGRLRLQAVALGAAIASHLVALFLLPAHWLRVARAPIRPVERAALVALPLALAGVCFAALGFRVSEIGRPLNILAAALDLARHGAAGLPPLSWVGRMAGDLANAVLLILPVPALLIFTRAAARSLPPAAPRIDRAFLAAAAAAGMFVAFVLVIPGSPAQDWDLVALTLLPLAVLGLAAGSPALGPRVPARVLAGLGALSLAGSLGFLLVNAIPEAGLRRFQMLMSDDARVSPHERAYGNEKLGDYYGERGDLFTALEYRRRALAADSANARYWGKVGSSLYEMERPGEALPHFLRAAAIRPGDAEPHYYAGFCLLKLGRPAEAVEELKRALRLAGDRPDYLGALGLAMVLSGDPEGARSTWDLVLRRWPGHEETRAALEYYFGTGESAPRAR